MEFGFGQENDDVFGIWSRRALRCGSIAFAPIFARHPPHGSD